MKKALIELIAENQAEGGDYTAVTGQDGGFHIEGIVPGRYRLFTERTGLLEVDKHHTRTEGRVLTLAAGQELKEVLIRLQAAAVVRGRVTDEDGEPMPNAQVSVLRQTFVSGRSRMEQVGSERTNDLGEYRIAGLPSGSYYLCVSPPPDFRSLIEAVGAAASADAGRGTASAAGQASTPATTYQTTYYPDTPDRSAAAPVELHAGDDFPANFSLIPSPSLSIRGAVVNLPPRASATIMLQSREFNVALNGAEMHKDGSFVIRDVAPGAYTIFATVDNAPVPMMARQSLMVSNSVEGLRLAPQSGGVVRGHLRLETKSNGRLDPTQFFLTLRPVDGEEDTLNMFLGGGGFSALTRVAADGSFEWKDVPSGNYYVQLAGDAGVGATLAQASATAVDNGWFLKSAAAQGRNVAESGISVSGGAISLDLVASASAAMVEGRVTNHKGEAVANTVIVAVPEARLRSRPDRYLKTASDQSGRFSLRGMPPGEYTLFAWESVDGEAYYSPEFLRKYEGQGSVLRVSEGDRKGVQLEVIASGEEQP